MHCLWVSTKLPLPAVDGGRLAMWLSLRGLARAGVRVAVLAPVSGAATDAVVEGVRLVGVSVRAPGRLRTLAQSLCTGQSLTVTRHRSEAVSAAVAAYCQSERPDVVHAEQLQAFAQAATGARFGVPVLLRMQNVESALWQQVAKARAWPLVWEARRVRNDERKAIKGAACCVALSATDAAELEALSGGVVCHVAQGFPAELAAGARLPGAPALSVLGSAGWWPNAQAAAWMLDTIWPMVWRSEPEARLHVFGGQSPSEKIAGVVWHAAPDDAAAAFPAGGIALIPLLIGSGIRMRILEAWARGVPVVTTPVGARGLDFRDGENGLIAATAADFAAAALRLGRDAELYARLVAGGRATLAADHDEGACAAALIALYRETVARGVTPR